MVTRSASFAPLSASVFSILRNVCRHCASKSPARDFPASSTAPVWPASQIVLPPSVMTAGEYARFAVRAAPTNNFFMVPPHHVMPALVAGIHDFTIASTDMDGRDKSGHDGLHCVMAGPPAHADGTLPLAGIRVLEFCHAIMGPSAGLILADLGADVIKIEPGAGDTTRR